MTNKENERQDSDGEPLLSFAEQTALYHSAVRVLQSDANTGWVEAFGDFHNLASPTAIIRLLTEIAWLRLKIATQMGVDANDAKAIDEILASMD